MGSCRGHRGRERLGMSARAGLALAHLSGGNLLYGSSTTLTDKGPGCAACTVAMGLLQFGAWAAEVQLSAHLGSCEGPLPGLRLSVSTVGRDREKWAGVEVGVDRERRERGRNERRETGREGGRLGEQRVLSN